MKNLCKIVCASLIMIVMNACSSAGNMPSQKVADLLQSGEFTFMAERANPTGGDVVNVLNSLPNSSSSRMLNLDYGYTLQIKQNVVKAELPYFGRMFTPSYDTSKNSYRFTSKDFTMEKIEGKKGSAVYNMTPKDLQNIRKINLEVFKNGKAYLSIDSNDRQPISYDGYIMANTPEKK